MAIVAKKIQSAKLEAIAATKAVFKDYKGFIFADYRGLTVENITDLRRKLNEKNAKLKVVKNTYARVVFDEMKIENVAEYLTGPTAIALTAEDANEVAKILFDFAKDVPGLQVKGFEKIQTAVPARPRYGSGKRIRAHRVGPFAL